MAFVPLIRVMIYVVLITVIDIGIEQEIMK